MTPMKIPHPPKPALSASNIELLASPHEKNRVQEFVASQTRYAKAQANEGRAVRASWDISTPEKDKMRLHLPSAGFETPVLRPRTVQIPAESNPDVSHSSPPRLKSPANKPTTSRQTPDLAKKAKATSAVRDVFSPKRQKGSEKKSTAKKSGTLNPTLKERRARSDTDEEHLARLTERRESKRARQNIMNSREVRAGTRGEKENKKDRKNELKEKKKHRIPAGLALMHGFSSTNVGKGRLTIEPPPNFGVFNKGKASVKVKVDESKRTKQRDRFLDTRPAKSPGQRPELQTSSGRNTSNEPSSPVIMKKSTAVQLQKTPIKMKETAGRRQLAASVRCDSEAANSYASKTVGRSQLAYTTSDIAIASVRSKPETALLDVRAAAWSKILKNDLPGEKAVPTSKPEENPQATSIFPTTAVLQGVTSKAHLEPEELATIGPWESASQVARTTLLCPQEQRSAFSRYFASLQCGKSGLTQPIINLANDPLGQPVGVDCANSSNAGDTTMDGPQVHEETGVDHQDVDVFPPAPANTSSGNKTFAFSEKRISASQTPSLDSVDRALHPTFLGRPVPWHNFNSTAENMLLQQYGLDPTDTHREVSRPFLYDQDDSKAADASNSLGDPITLGNMQDSALSSRGENHTEGLGGNSEDQPWHNEWYPAIVSDSQDVVFTPPNASYECQGEAPFLQDMGHEEANEIEEDCTGFASVSISSADGSIFLEDDAGETAINHLWRDESWAQGHAAGGNAFQGGCSYLTSVQKVEQDVAKKLKDHWFPQKF
ncbi:hypothetical protein BGY98DRAFT_1173700 [Russula aff. rugulosa BPL654]|nr:hypothetical protein BGY98DRAFT_1173700 [Russula aff. rugulosa BPL654]